MLKQWCLSCDGKYSQGGLLVLRVAVGVVFFAHGAQKLWGWFGGGGIAQTSAFFAQVGLAPAVFWAWVIGLVEFFGGLALILGFLTTIAATLLAISMVVALFAVHLRNGFFLQQGGMEYVLTLLAATVALVLSGPGKWAVDSRCRKR